jgi:HNH endonuclease
MTTLPLPLYSSYGDYRGKVPLTVIMRKCSGIARTANRPRLYSGPAIVRLAATDVFSVLNNAQGRCCYCNSLAVDNKPSLPNGAPLPWADIGRRIGSLEHLIPRMDGGDNDADNLAWACLWCNTWHAERIWNATDHGAILAV